MYKNFKDIPQFPHAPYRVNMPFKFMQSFLDDNNAEINPEYQRGYVWTQEQKERYLEYLVMGGKSGRDIYFNCPNWMGYKRGDTKWHETLELVDGKQRVSSVLEFLENKVKVFGKYINEYEDKVIFLRSLNADLIFHVNSLQTPKEVIEWYLGMNNGGTIHTEDDLNVARKVLEKYK